MIDPAIQSRKVKAMDRIGDRLRRLMDDEATDVSDRLVELMERLEARLSARPADR